MTTPEPDHDTVAATDLSTDLARAVRSLGVELEWIRQLKGLSRSQAVALLLDRTGQDIHPRTLRAYECSTRNVTVDRLLGLAETYEVPAVRILENAIVRAGLSSACPACGRHP